MRKLAVLVVLALGASLANADSIPTFNLTQGTVLVTNITAAFSEDTFTFSNGNGTTIGGVDEFLPLGMNAVAGGGTGNPFLLLGLNLDTANVNGSGLFLFGSVTITGADFTLPSSGTTFTATTPVIFSGSFRSCAGSFGSFGGCNPGTNFLGQFNINGPGTLSAGFISVPVGDGIVWQLSSATYTLNAVPEPATIVLLGTGALAIFGKLRRRKA